MSFYLYSRYPSKRKYIDDIYYFDNNSTTLIEDQTVKDEIVEWLSCGNPSNDLHDMGRMAKDKIEECRHFIAFDFKVSPSEIYFTSGATESNNMVILGIVRHYISRGERFTVITSSFEHPSVYNVFKHFEDEPLIDIVYIDPCSDRESQNCGRILPEDVERCIKNAQSRVRLVSIMFANNETGAINDVRSIGKICKTYKTYFHCDATQALGKFIINPSKLGIHSMTFSGHKFHGPKGIGGLYLNKNKRCHPNICYGGEQESHKRPGTENVANIAGMTQALRIAHENRDEKNRKMMELRNYIEDELRKDLNIDILGCKKYRLPNTILCLVKDLGNCNKVLVRELNEKRIYVSIGSACQTKKKASHVLKTMGITDEESIRIIRISLSDYTTKEQADYFIKNFISIVKSMKK